MNKKMLSLFSATTIILAACGVPKDLAQKIESSKKETVELPLDYANVFPSQMFDQWDKDYNYYDRYLTRDIMKTQMGLSMVNNGVETWWCMPSARTHVQLDTATMITDRKAVIGNWRIVCNRKVSYTDSMVYAQKKIYRNTKLIRNETADAFLSITDTKFNLYGADKEGEKFKPVVSRNYQIESKRFLMLYKLSNKAAAAISFIGIDKEGRLIINSYIVQERKIKGTYITYEAVMVQTIYKRAA